jgi:hypothetical protein
LSAKCRMQSAEWGRQCKMQSAECGAENPETGTRKPEPGNRNPETGKKDNEERPTANAQRSTLRGTALGAVEGVAGDIVGDGGGSVFAALRRDFAEAGGTRG